MVGSDVLRKVRNAGGAVFVRPPDTSRASEPPTTKHKPPTTHPPTYRPQQYYSMWSPGDVRDASPEFPLYDFHLDGKTDTAACSDIIAHSSGFCRFSVWVLRRRSVRGKGPPGACGSAALRVSLSPWIHWSGSQAVGLLPWIGGGTGNTNSLGVNCPVLGDHLTSWDQNPKVLKGARNGPVGKLRRMSGPRSTSVARALSVQSTWASSLRGCVQPP